MLRLQAHTDEAGGEVSEAGEAGEQAECDRRSERTGAVKNSVEKTVGEDLYSLGVADGLLAIVLDTL